MAAAVMASEYRHPQNITRELTAGLRSGLEPSAAALKSREKGAINHRRSPAVVIVTIHRTMGEKSADHVWVHNPL